MAAVPNMITLHHLNNSRSQRILWLLEELAVPYQIVFHQRDAHTSLAPPELKAVHALGKSPVITDGDIVVAESGAIIEYLLHAYGPGLYPSVGSEQHRQFSYWMHFAEGTLMTQMLIKMMFERVKMSPMPFFIKPIARMIADKAIAAYAGPNVAANLAFVDAHLSCNQWFCGDELSGADFQMSFPLEAAMSREGSETYPAIAAYVQRIHARDAYQAALEKGGDYAYG